MLLAWRSFAWGANPAIMERYTSQRLSTFTEKRKMTPSATGVLFWAAVATLLLPPLLVRHFPSADGPAHVLNASLLNRLIFQHDVSVRAWYVLNPVVVPNWSGHALLMLLVSILPGPNAERALIAMYSVTFLLAFRYMLRGVSIQTRGLELLALPLVYNMHLYWGFYSFCLSLVFYLFLLGYVLRSERIWTIRHLFLLASLAMLLYLSHGLGFLFGLMAAAMLAVAGEHQFFTSRLREGLRVGLAFLPGIFLLAIYLGSPGAREGSLTEWPRLRYAASTLATMAPIAPFGGIERVLAGLYAIGLYGLVALRVLQVGRNSRRPELLLLALLGGAAVFALPVTTSGGTMVTPRLVYFPAFALSAWLAANSIPRQWAVVIAALSVAVAVGFQLNRLSLYRAYDRDLTQLTASLRDQLRPGGVYVEYTADTLGPLTNAGRLSSPDLSPSALCFFGVSTHNIILSNYEAHQGHFPLLFRRERDPFRLYFREGKLQPAAIEQGATGSAVDGIIGWCNSNGKGMCESTPFHSCYRRAALPQGPPEGRWFLRHSCPSDESAP
jgi:hypothetical protein